MAMVMEHNLIAKCRTIVSGATLFVLTCGWSWSGTARAQAAAATKLQFEVASVKQNISESDASNMNHRLADRFTATNTPLFFLILDAYEVKGHQLIGAPDWTWNKSYDVIGTFPGGIRPHVHEIHLMEQHLLEDRFDLKLHPEQREIAAYDLVLTRKDGQLGPQIHKSSMDCTAWAADGRPKTDAGPKSPVAPSGERPVCSLLTTRTWLSGGARTIEDIAGSLEAMVDRPVVNKTGLTGVYDVDLQWARTDLHAGDTAPASTADAPSLFTAVEEQLGLKLIPHKEKFDVLVVDDVQPPTPN